MNEDKILREVVEEAYLSQHEQLHLKDVKIAGLMEKTKTHLGSHSTLQQTITKLQRELVKKDKKIAELKKTLAEERTKK